MNIQINPKRTSEGIPGEIPGGIPETTPGVISVENLGGTPEGFMGGILEKEVMKESQKMQ